MSIFLGHPQWLKKLPGFAMIGILWSASMACSVNLVPPTPTLTPTSVVLLPVTLIGATLTPAPIPPNLPTATAKVDGDLDGVPLDVPVVSTPIGTPTQGALDVCALLTEGEVTAVLGEAIDHATRIADAEEIPPTETCTWVGQSKTKALVLTVAKAKSQGEIESYANQQLLDTVAEEDIKAEQDGLGKRVYWTVTDESGGYVVITNSTAFILAVGGKIGDPNAFRAVLRSTTLLVTGRLP
jgi:hypothetical protein